MKVLGSVFLLMLLVACKGGGDDSVTSGSSSLNGVYQSCENNTEDQYSVRSTIYVNADMISEVIRYYENLNCVHGNDQFEDRSTYSYAKNGSGYRLSYVGMTSTSLSNADVNFNNTYSYCGFNNWSLNIPKITLGQDCDDLTINEGDWMDLKVKKSGTTLVVTSPGGTFKYPQLGAWNFADQGQTVADSSWFYYDGTIGAILTTSAGAYSLTYFDPASMKHITENGTYTSANNIVQTTPANYSPDCGDPVGVTASEKFAQTNSSLAVQGATANEGTLFEKMPLTNAEMKSVFLAGFTAGCL